MSGVCAKGSITMERTCAQAEISHLNTKKEMSTHTERAEEDNLYMFFGDGCPFTKKVSPEVVCAENATGVGQVRNSFDLILFCHFLEICQTTGSME